MHDIPKSRMSQAFLYLLHLCWASVRVHVVMTFSGIFACMSQGGIRIYVYHSIYCPIS